MRLFQITNDSIHKIIYSLNLSYLKIIVHLLKLDTIIRFYSFEPDGKIIAYNMKTGEASVFADNLITPNGIELHRNGR